MSDAAVDSSLLADSAADLPLVDHEVVLEGRVWDVRRDTVDLGAAGPVVREYLDHPGAVAVLATDVRGGVEHVLLIRQYRHPVRSMLWELPAGLCDVADEPYETTARRELWEETSYDAERLEPLIDPWLSPGSTNEHLAVFHATGVRPADGPAHDATGEELGMEVRWVPYAEVLEGVLAGRLRNPSLVLGILALTARRSPSA